MAVLLPLVVGIDVSKAALAVCYQRDHPVQHLEVSNTKAGFQQLLKTCGTDCLFVLEATPRAVTIWHSPIIYRNTAHAWQYSIPWL